MGTRFNREDVSLGAIMVGLAPTDTTTTPQPKDTPNRAYDWGVLTSGTVNQILTVQSGGSIAWAASRTNRPGFVHCHRRDILGWPRGVGGLASQRAASDHGNDDRLHRRYRNDRGQRQYVHGQYGNQCLHDRRHRAGVETARTSRLLMANSVYAPGSTAPGTTATGRPNQGHVGYAVNQGYWYVLTLSSTQTLALYYSTNGTTWSAGGTYTLTLAHGSEGRNFGFCYANLGGTDVLHVLSGYNSASGGSFHSRFTLGASGSLTNTNAETTTKAVFSPSGGAGDVMGGMPAVGSGGVVWDWGDFNNNADSGGVANYWAADTGGAWTPGSPSGNYALETSGSWTDSFGILPQASGNMLAISDNSSSSTVFTNLDSYYWNGSTWAAGLAVFASSITQVDCNAWGSCKVSNTSLHCVALSSGGNTYTHRTNAGGGAAWAAGNTIPTLTYGTTSGVALVSDGTNVWAWVIDSSGNLKYCKWNGTAWGSWTVQEATLAGSPRYAVAAYSAAANGIVVIWTKTNGSNFEVWSSFLSLAAAPSGFPPSPFLVFPPMYFPSMIEE